MASQVFTAGKFDFLFGEDLTMKIIHKTVGKREMGSQCFIGTEVRFGQMESSGGGWWGRLHDSVNVRNATGQYT